MQENQTEWNLPDDLTVIAVTLGWAWNKGETSNLVHCADPKISPLIVVSFEYSEADLALCLITIFLSHICKLVWFKWQLFDALCYRSSDVECEWVRLSPSSKQKARDPWLLKESS